MKGKMFFVAFLILILVVASPLSAYAKDDTKYSENVIVTPQSIMTVFDHYEQSSAAVNYQMKYIGQVSIDNLDNPYTYGHLQFEAEQSGTWQASLTIGSSIGAEVDAIVAKVTVSVSISGTISRSWTDGKKYGASVDVPPNKFCVLKAYIPGTTSSGQGVYRIYNTTDGSYQEYKKPLGAKVPALSAWHVKPYFYDYDPSN